MIRSHYIRQDGKEMNKGMPTGIPLFYSLTNLSRRRHAPDAPRHRGIRDDTRAGRTWAPDCRWRPAGRRSAR